MMVGDGMVDGESAEPVPAQSEDGGGDGYAPEDFQAYEES
jgi:hypothetical protein